MYAAIAWVYVAFSIHSANNLLKTGNISGRSFIFKILAPSSAFPLMSNRSACFKIANIVDTGIELPLRFGNSLQNSSNISSLGCCPWTCQAWHICHFSKAAWVRPNRQWGGYIVWTDIIGLKQKASTFPPFLHPYLARDIGLGQSDMHEGPSDLQANLAYTAEGVWDSLCTLLQSHQKRSYYHLCCRWYPKYSSKSLRLLGFALGYRTFNVTWFVKNVFNKVIFHQLYRSRYNAIIVSLLGVTLCKSSYCMHSS